MAQVILRLIRAHGNQRREITATENLFSEIDAQHEKYVTEREKLMKKQKI
jgi:hypothetical protein